ncbi:MAG: DUF4383 domain-containing protein [Parachlamydiaceae bacterium]|nr:DUF4383 domain-containing protein [Parachlamydiaceae bacterium]
MLRILTFFVGILFIIAAVLGFMPEFFSDGKFLGVFAIRSLNNIAHLAIGIIGLLCAFKNSRVCTYFFIALGVIFGILALLGLFDNTMTLFQYFTTNAPLNVFYATFSLIALYIGFTSLRT